MRTFQSYSDDIFEHSDITHIPHKWLSTSLLRPSLQHTSNGLVWETLLTQDTQRPGRHYEQTSQLECTQPRNMATIKYGAHALKAIVHSNVEVSQILNSTQKIDNILKREPKWRKLSARTSIRIEKKHLECIWWDTKSMENGQTSWKMGFEITHKW